MSLLIFCVIAVCVVTRILIDLVVMQHRHWPGAQHPANQLDAYHHGVAAIFRHLRLAGSCCAGHKEFALPQGRKTDPSLDMVAFRARVDAILAGSIAPLAPIPAATAVALGGAIRPTLRRGVAGDVEAIKLWQREVGVEQTGTFGPRTEAAVREFQRQRGMVADGIIGPRTWAALLGTGAKTAIG